MTSEDVPEGRPVRRRSSAEVRARILAAAQAQFAAGGMDGTTTRAIADEAEVAEHLIFRHFQSKANLFEEAIIKPFTAVFEEFLASMGTDEREVETRNRTVVQALYRFLQDHSAFLQALIKSSGQSAGNLTHALDGYFTIAEERLRLFYRPPADGYDVPPHLFVRYTFGMVASAVLFDRWFFPDGPVGEGDAAAALSRIAFKAMQPLPVPSDDYRGDLEA